MRSVICFDLDGTLTDPAEGITRCIQFACERLGLPVMDREQLLFAIGPPLQNTFALLMKTDDAHAIQIAVDLYRERYAARGMLLENAVYPGVEDMLRRLTKAGKRLFVATSKPTVYAVQILRHFHLNAYFTTIYGSELNGIRTDKAELLAHLLESESLSAAEVAMVGDRMHDIAGARHNGIYPIGVTYGYGNVQELMEAGAGFLCHTPAEVADLLCENRIRNQAGMPA